MSDKKILTIVGSGDQMMNALMQTVGNKGLDIDKDYLIREYIEKPMTKEEFIKGLISKEAFVHYIYGNVSIIGYDSDKDELTVFINKTSNTITCKIGDLRTMSKYKKYESVLNSLADGNKEKNAFNYFEDVVIPEAQKK